MQKRKLRNELDVMALGLGSMASALATDPRCRRGVKRVADPADGTGDAGLGETKPGLWPLQLEGDELESATSYSEPFRGPDLPVGTDLETPGRP